MMNEIDFLKIIRGLPFVDDDFDGKQLLRMVASLRNELSGNISDDSLPFLEPQKAKNVYLYAMKACPVLPINAELTDAENIKIEAAVQRITNSLPKWKALFSIPLVWRKLETGEVSATNPLIPQHIFLGARAFQDVQILDETIVHEMSHVWCSFMAEIRDFQTIKASRDLVLPSGTKGKNVRGVMLAALFAAAAINLYKGSGSKYADNRRVDHLRKYLGMCLKTLESRADISVMGTQILHSLLDFKKINNIR